MANIKIPEFLEQKLASDAALRSAVDQQRHHFSAWLHDSKMPFFPDYTDHGISHLESVLATSCALIPDSAKELISAADAAVLSLSVFYHDCGMHLSEAGFKELVHGSYQKHVVAPFDSKMWGELWSEFLFSARRWDDNKRIDVFGADEHGAPRAIVRDPFKEWNNLNEGDKRLIGEFIRLHHARLAHHVALFGVPGNTGIAIEPSKEPTSEQQDLAGLVARSHGLPIRSCLDYIQDKYQRREFQGVHAVYLMALLRVADYLQVDASRAPAIAFRYKFIPSKISQLEHKAHHAVRNITATHEDPESLEIQTKPEEVEVFLRLKEWLVGMQAEIDASWAVLGEVYGSHSILKLLGLKFRRIRSNLDDVKTFSETVPYVPGRIRFDVARAELLKLLIRPLYGDEPSYGVREMIQNSVDAVSELEVFLNDHPEHAAAPRRAQKHDVEVHLEELDKTGHAWMTISDRGMGMTEEIIRDYFLRAGASFRRSEQWREDFEISEKKVLHQPKSKVLRSGRFGIGALGAFLIGNEIEVETRHITSTKGFRFKTSLETESISLEKDASISVGTSVRIRLGAETHKKLKQAVETARRPRGWDWHVFSKPSVVRFFPNSRTPKYTSHRGNLPDSEIIWRKLELNLPYEVYWTKDHRVPALTCNGLFICNGSGVRKVYAKTIGLDGQAEVLAYPSIAILDSDGHFPLTLQRNDLSVEDYPFGRELVVDVLLEMIAWLFFHGPNQFFPLKRANIYLGQWIDSWRAGKRLVLTNDGYGLEIIACLGSRKFKQAIFCENPEIITAITSADIIFTEEWSESRFQERDYIYGWPELHFVKPKSSSTKSFSKRYVVWQRAKKKKPQNLSIEERSNGWKLISEKGCSPAGFTLGNLPKPPEEKRYIPTLLSEIYFKDVMQLSGKRWLLDDLWDELFEGKLLPYDKVKRIKQFPEAAKKLERFKVTSDLNIREANFEELT